MIPRSPDVRWRYSPMAMALLNRLRSDSRTNFGAPVEPDVLISSARSGCSARAGTVRRDDVEVVAIDADHGVRAPDVGETVDVAAGEQRHVGRVEEGQVADDELERVGAREQDHRDVRARSSSTGSDRRRDRPGRRRNDHLPPAAMMGRSSASAPASSRSTYSCPPAHGHDRGIVRVTYHSHGKEASQSANKLTSAATGLDRGRR